MIDMGYNTKIPDFALVYGCHNILLTNLDFILIVYLI